MPIYFAWFTTALLSVGGDANDQNLPQSGRLLYCVRRGFLDINPKRLLQQPQESIYIYRERKALTAVQRGITIASTKTHCPKVEPRRIPLRNGL
jgi:hypothetical protein